MSQYLALVRLYYLVDGKKVCAPANTVAFDFPEDEADAAIANGYLRKATVGEIAEAESKRPAKEPKKRAAKAEKADDKKVETEKKGDAGEADKKPDNDLA